MCLCQVFLILHLIQLTLLTGTLFSLIYDKDGCFVLSVEWPVIHCGFSQLFISIVVYVIFHSFSIKRIYSTYITQISNCHLFFFFIHGGLQFDLLQYINSHGCFFGNCQIYYIQRKIRIQIDDQNKINDITVDSIYIIRVKSNLWTIM